jgi:hypothetical protein
MPEACFFGNFAGIQKLLFYLVTQPAQQCSGLDIPDRETVPEPDRGFIVSRFQRYFVHSHIPFLFPGKKRQGEEEERDKRNGQNLPDYGCIFLLWKKFS